MIVEHNDIVLIEVPEGANRFSFGFSIPSWVYYYLKDNANSWDHRHTELPPGQYEIVGLAKDLMGSDWLKIITPSIFDTAIDCGISLIKSKNLKPETTLIVRKIK